MSTARAGVGGGPASGRIGRRLAAVAVARQAVEQAPFATAGHGPREAGWVVRAYRPGHFRTRGFDEIPALALCAERVADTLPAPAPREREGASRA